MWSKLWANLLPIGSNSLIDPVRQLLGILPWIPKEPRYPIITSHLISSFVKSIQIYDLNLNKRTRKVWYTYCVMNKSFAKFIRKIDPCYFKIWMWFPYFWEMVGYDARLVLFRGHSQSQNSFSPTLKYMSNENMKWKINPVIIVFLRNAYRIMFPLDFINIFTKPRNVSYENVYKSNFIITFLK